MMTKSVSLSNGRTWKTQSEALSYFKAMLARYSNSQIIPPGPDHDDLVALLTRYDANLTDPALTKTGTGIDYFSRESNSGIGWSTDGFWVHRVDGTSIDFSYISAVKEQPKT